MLDINKRTNEKNGDSKNAFVQSACRIQNLMRITDIITVIKNYQKNWAEHLERKPENWIPKLPYQCKLKGR